MLILLSPAKSLDFSPPPRGLPTSRPRLMDDIELLVERCRELSTAELAKLMRLSDKLADLNHRRFQEMSLPFTPDNAKAALLAFRGDVYRRFDAASLSADDLLWAQDHVRILSGLYGLLRPLDLIQPYRLEMGTRLSTERGGTLYAFWGDRLVELLNGEHRQRRLPAVLNLASNEYVKAVPVDRLEPPMVSVRFQELRDGKLKTIAFSAKRARGRMARFVVQNRLAEPSGLKEFREAGYAFRPELSSDDDLLFTRERPAA